MAGNEFEIIKRIGVATPEHLEKWEAVLTNPRDKFLIRALFEGISGPHLDELSNIKVSDVDAEACTITLTKRKINVSKHLCELALESASANTYRKEDGTEYQFLDSDKDMVVKSFSSCASAFERERRLKNTYLRIMKILGEEDLVRELQIGGKVFFINKRCKELGISAKDYLYGPHIEELNAQFGGKVVRATFLKAYGEFLTA